MRFWSPSSMVVVLVVRMGSATPLLSANGASKQQEASSKNGVDGLVRFHALR